MNEQRGFTLIELLVTSMLTVLVLTIVGGILINTISAQQTVQASADTGNQGQLVAQSVTRGIQGADAIGIVASSTGTELLVARTVGPEATPVWRCQAWYYDGDGVYTTSSTSGAPTESQAQAGTLLGEGVTTVGGARVFELPDVPSDDTFSTADRRVDLTFEIQVGDGTSMLVETSAVSRQAVPTPSPSASPSWTGGEPCF